MKKLFGGSISAILLAPSIALAQAVPIPPANADVFGGDGNKVEKIMQFVSWAVQGGAVMFAVICLVLAGNYMNRGEYSRALGAFVGGAVSGLAPFVVNAIRGI